ncbi:MAG: hydantoinase B/oxoprolinase family protein [Pseudomonadota bacterium]
MLDPVTLTVLQHRFRQIAEEMDIVLDRAAFSPIISEGRDRASGLYTAADGLLIAQGSTSMPIHIGAMQFAVGTIARKRGPHRPGDIYMINDPYLGGTHLMDMKFVMPVFLGDELFCFLGSSGHWPDIGGAAPGGYATKAVEVQQEGLRIGGIKVYREGKLDDDLLMMILDNVRVPAQRRGDFHAQVASLRVGEQELRKAIDEYGIATLREAIAQLDALSARLVRDKIARIKPGTYSFEDFMDNDGIDDRELWVRLDLTARPDRLVFDFSRSSPPCRGPLNSVFSTTCSAVYIAFKHVYPEIPMNGGCFRPIEVIAPQRTFLNASYPQPVSGCAAEVSQRIIDVCFGALAQAIPEKLHGAPVGTSINVAIGGYDPGEDRRYIFYFYTGGGHGGYAGGDGISNACTSVGLAKTPPLEVVEQQTPIVFDEYALRPDSCGPGERRGGLGVRYRLRLSRGEGQVSVLGDRAKRGPFGIEGGGSGEVATIEMECRGKTYVPELRMKDENIPIHAGDAIQVETPGGGGYGDPQRRLAQDVATDLARGYVTPDFAVRHYGWKKPAASQKAAR